MQYSDFIRIDAELLTCLRNGKPWEIRGDKEYVDEQEQLLRFAAQQPAFNHGPTLNSFQANAACDDEEPLELPTLNFGAEPQVQYGSSQPFPSYEQPVPMFLGAAGAGVYNAEDDEPLPMPSLDFSDRVFGATRAQQSQNRLSGDSDDEALDVPTLKF